MKRIFYSFLFTFLIIGVIFLLNINLITKQCINYECSAVRIPLYLKALDFLGRHYNYRHLAQGIIAGSQPVESKVFKIFEWTFRNIRKTPAGIPVIDDHAWHIIIRGYGEADQACDVFTTLCNYAGVDAFFGWISAGDGSKRKIPLAFARMNKSWFIFDPYRGVYFKNKEDKLISLESIRSGQGWITKTIDLSLKPDIDYQVYLLNLPSLKDVGLQRANIQSPLRRLIFAIKKKAAF